MVSKYGKVLIQKLTPQYGFNIKEEEENTRHGGCTLVGTPKGTSHW